MPEIISNFETITMLVAFFVWWAWAFTPTCSFGEFGESYSSGLLKCLLGSAISIYMVALGPWTVSLEGSGNSPGLKSCLQTQRLYYDKWMWLATKFWSNCPACSCRAREVTALWSGFDLMINPLSVAGRLLKVNGQYLDEKIPRSWIGLQTGCREL